MSSLLPPFSTSSLSVRALVVCLQIKHKFQREERAHKNLVDAALVSSVHFDYDAHKLRLSAAAAAAGTDSGTPAPPSAVV
jgi:hypothetical protein